MKLRHLRLWIVLGVIALVLRPADAAAGKNAARIAGGYQHSLGLKADGTVWAWGYNNYGQLGDGSTTNRLTPVPVSGLTGCVAIAAGYYHSLGLKADGTVWAWGYNNYGQLGDDSTANRLTPVPVSPVSGLTGCVANAGGFYHSLGLKADGSLWAWGRNTEGALGLGDTTNRLSPTQIKVFNAPRVVVIPLF